MNYSKETRNQLLLPVKCCERKRISWKEKKDGKKEEDGEQEQHEEKGQQGGNEEKHEDEIRGGSGRH